MPLESIIVVLFTMCTGWAKESANLTTAFDGVFLHHFMGRNIFIYIIPSWSAITINCIWVVNHWHIWFDPLDPPSPLIFYNQKVKIEREE